MEARTLRLAHVLCPTDFSDFSARALRHAIAVAKELGGDLTVPYVCPYVVPLGGEVPYYASEQLGSVARAEMIGRLKEFSEPAVAAGVQVRFPLLEGDPAREIARLAETLPADLLVLGTHGRGGFERFLLGSVTEKLLHRAACPILTVCHADGPGESTRPRRILCATDLRGASEPVVDYALALAEARHAELTLLHVLEGAPEFEPGAPLRFSVPESHELREALERAARERLRTMLPQETRRRVEVRELIAAGRAYKEILRLAREDGPELIVMGAHGHGALEHMLFGSTTHHVVREAPCPVLVVRPPALRRGQGQVA
ncbi:MAG TPA: universal stress protein [Vicinamibacteria bacterium]|nr:universal stress protein [Vicinamibacteria bacterium]